MIVEIGITICRPTKHAPFVGNITPLAAKPPHPESTWEMLGGQLNSATS